MTMPHLMNCAHSPDGWCLSCVRELYEEMKANDERWRFLRDSCLSFHLVPLYTEPIQYSILADMGDDEEFIKIYDKDLDNLIDRAIVIHDLQTKQERLTDEEKNEMKENILGELRNLKNA